MTVRAVPVAAVIAFQPKAKHQRSDPTDRQID